jgi:hypothetical protein
MKLRDNKDTQRLRGMNKTGLFLFFFFLKKCDFETKNRTRWFCTMKHRSEFPERGETRQNQDRSTNRTRSKVSIIKTDHDRKQRTIGERKRSETLSWSLLAQVEDRNMLVCLYGCVGRKGVTALLLCWSRCTEGRRWLEAALCCSGEDAEVFF